MKRHAPVAAFAALTFAAWFGVARQTPHTDSIYWCWWPAPWACVDIAKPEPCPPPKLIPCHEVSR